MAKSIWRECENMCVCVWSFMYLEKCKKVRSCLQVYKYWLAQTPFPLYKLKITYFAYFNQKLRLFFSCIVADT